MILCEWDASEGHPGQSCVHLYARILSTSFISVSIFSVWCYSSVLYLNGLPYKPATPWNRKHKDDRSCTSLFFVFNLNGYQVIQNSLKINLTLWAVPYRLSIGEKPFKIIPVYGQSSLYVLASTHWKSNDLYKSGAQSRVNQLRRLYD